ncbi:MEDS domain-containing protein, partial [Actinomadura adrarensis]
MTKLEHRAFLYDDIEQFLMVTVPYLTEGAIAGDVVTAIVQQPKLDALRDILVPEFSDAIMYVETEEFYRHPVHTLKTYHEIIHTNAPRPIRALGEGSWEKWSPRETVEWTRYESLVNVVFGEARARALCVYDNKRLPPEIIAHARETHPQLLDPMLTMISPGYVDPPVFGRRCDRAAASGR